jgi:hypothetical protein
LKNKKNEAGEIMERGNCVSMVPGDLSHRTAYFLRCFGGWALDALDVQIFELVIPTLIATDAVRTPDLGDKASTADFTQSIIRRLGA